MINSWAREDDEKVALHYLRYGNAEHDTLIAALPQHKASSVVMRLGNFQGIDTNGEHGLSHASQQERSVWAFVSAVRDAVTENAAVAAFTAAMAPGSYLICSAGTSTGTSPALIACLQAAYQGITVVTGRTEAEIAAYFDGLDLVPPGLTDVWAWRPDRQWFWPPPPSARILGGVARKPAAAPGRLT
jgi:S-adenosyl methyltransferase